MLASTGWSELAVVPAKTAQPAQDLPGGASKTIYLGALGMTGKGSCLATDFLASLHSDDSTPTVAGSLALN